MSTLADYRHTYKLFALVLLLAGAAAAVRLLLVPADFGLEGHFRAAAPVEIAATAPRHLGEVACARCHPRQARLHDKDAHGSVACEACHGPGQAHAARPATPVRVPRGQAPCLVCHQRLPARATFFPQVEPAEHYRMVGVKDQATACTGCHDPHEPLFMDRDLRTARLHPLVHRCRDCHAGSSRDRETPRPPGHPAIFECGDCHKAIAADHATRSHRKVTCNTCHLFFRESEFAGRIIRDADPRFCLLCHGKASFRSASAPPSVEWPQHREEMGGEAGKACVDCHRDHIHQGSDRGSRE